MTLFAHFVGFTNAEVQGAVSGLCSPEQTIMVALYGDGDDHGPSLDCVKCGNEHAHVAFVMSP